MLKTPVAPVSPSSKSSAQLLKRMRQIHLYFGLFISPALMFFAFTGAVQTLSLHEAAGSSYKPPAVLAVWGQIHKKQTWILPAHRPPAQGDHHDTTTPPAASAAAQPGGSARPEAAGEGRPIDRSGAQREGARSGASAPSQGAAAPSGQQQPITLRAKQKQHLPLKIFFLVVSLGLFTSTLTGIYMAYRYDRNKLLVTGLLLAGVILPLVLLPF